MTREKARDAVILAITADIKLALIDKIYDDFESRVCENCKHHKYIEKSYRMCNKLEIATSSDFGCNRFERREDEL